MVIKLYIISYLYANKLMVAQFFYTLLNNIIIIIK